ncbi:MAG: hypothetical protein KGO96_07660 [Elusimicrobia bacterium]|nr:hypothetical protein [Elusimicrobiota bacterium]
METKIEVKELSTALLKDLTFEQKEDLLKTISKEVEAERLSREKVRLKEELNKMVDNMTYVRHIVHKPRDNPFVDLFWSVW